MSAAALDMAGGATAVCLTGVGNVGKFLAAEPIFNGASSLRGTNSGNGLLPGSPEKSIILCECYLHLHPNLSF